jgi:hypothetical protein
LLATPLKFEHYSCAPSNRPKGEQRFAQAAFAARVVFSIGIPGVASKLLKRGRLGEATLPSPLNTNKQRPSNTEGYECCGSGLISAMESTS